METYTKEDAHKAKTAKRPVYRNIRLFVKLFIATFKYLVALSAIVFIGLYSYYIFFLNQAMADAMSAAIGKIFKPATISGSEAAGSRAQGCIIEGVPQCSGNAIPERELFRPIN